MTITTQQREQAEAGANEIQLRLYAEPESGEQMWNIATKFNLTERSAYRSFAQMVGDVILGFYKQQDLLALVQSLFPQLNPTQQLELELEIKKFLLPLSSIPSPAVTSRPNLAAEISATEHDLESIHSIRTMAHDMQEAKVHPVTHPTTPEKTYQSSQADLLEQIETMAKPSTAPRWDTES